MLSSTNRRILNIVCVSLAIIAMGIGLGMRYAEPKSTTGSNQMEISNLSESEKFELIADRDSIQRVRLLFETNDTN